MASTGTSVWIASSGDGTVTELRASDGARLCTLKAGPSPYGIAIADGHPWVTSYSTNEVRLY